MPGQVIIPSTVDDVVRAVGAARAAGVQLRCIAHGDTWTPVFFDEVLGNPSQVACSWEVSWPVQTHLPVYEKGLMKIAS